MHKALLVVLVVGISSVASAAPKLSFEEPTVKGALDAKVITAAIKRSSTQLLACYKKELANQPGLAGAATATFKIASDGKVSHVEVDGFSSAVDTCIGQIITKLRFAKPKDGQLVEVIYPLTYESGEVAGGAFASLTGTADISSGFDDTNIYGGLYGDEQVEGKLGPGGGGTGWGTIGTGRYGTIGSGSGYGVGGGRGGMRGRIPPVPTTSLGQATVTNHTSLDKAIIRRYIKRNIQKIQYCYEKELLTKPTVAGTMITEFTIGIDGKVSASAASGLEDTNVETCVAAVIKAIEFPKPKSGELVVRYPFTFRPAPDEKATKPAGAKADAKPADTKPAEPKPIEAKPAEPTK